MIAWIFILSLLAAEPAPATLPHLRVDREKRCVDVEADVVLREGEWIELLACAPKSREHESILTVRAQPSHIHLALLTLGLEPGTPMVWKYTPKSIEVTPPRGPRVRVSILTPRDGQMLETPAGDLIINQKTGQVLADSIWLFTGSGFAKLNDQQVYRADVGGTVISIVNFGDDMLARSTLTTNQNDEAAWGANTAKIPPVGTAVTLRLTVVNELAATQPASTQPATQPMAP